MSSIEIEENRTVYFKLVESKVIQTKIKSYRMQGLFFILAGAHIYKIAIVYST